jgi:hypothetical protein
MQHAQRFCPAPAFSQKLSSIMIHTPANNMLLHEHAAAVSSSFYACVCSGDVCSSFDGVYCGWVLGSWRAVGVQLQLDAAVVSFNDSAMAPQGVLAGMSYLRELEVLCVTHRPPSPGEHSTVQYSLGSTQ